MRGLRFDGFMLFLVAEPLGPCFSHWSQLAFHTATLHRNHLRQVSAVLGLPFVICSPLVAERDSLVALVALNGLFSDRPLSSRGNSPGRMRLRKCERMECVPVTDNGASNWLACTQAPGSCRLSLAKATSSSTHNDGSVSDRWSRCCHGPVPSGFCQQRAFS